MPTSSHNSHFLYFTQHDLGQFLLTKDNWAIIPFHDFAAINDHDVIFTTVKNFKITYTTLISQSVQIFLRWIVFHSLWDSSNF